MNITNAFVEYRNKNSPKIEDHKFTSLFLETKYILGKLSNCYPDQHVNILKSINKTQLDLHEVIRTLMHLDFKEIEREFNRLIKNESDFKHFNKTIDISESSKAEIVQLNNRYWSLYNVEAPGIVSKEFQNKLRLLVLSLKDINTSDFKAKDANRVNIGLYIDKLRNPSYSDCTNLNHVLTKDLSDEECYLIGDLKLIEIVKEQKEISEGACKKVYKVKGTRPISKCSKTKIDVTMIIKTLVKTHVLMSDLTTKTLLQDILVQNICVLISNEFNALLANNGINERISVLLTHSYRVPDDYLLEIPTLVDPDGYYMYQLESCLYGDYVKYNNNLGYINEKFEDHISHAFSHFSSDYTGGAILICDVQGVENNFTDLQLCSLKGGMTSMDTGRDGVLLFLTNHKCGRYCNKLKLSQPRHNSANEAMRELAKSFGALSTSGRTSEISKAIGNTSLFDSIMETSGIKVQVETIKKRGDITLSDEQLINIIKRNMGSLKK